MPSKMGEVIHGWGGMVAAEVVDDHARVEILQKFIEASVYLDASHLEDLIDQLTEAREVLWRNLGRKMEGGGNGLA